MVPLATGFPSHAHAQSPNRGGGEGVAGVAMVKLGSAAARHALCASDPSYTLTVAASTSNRMYLGGSGGSTLDAVSCDAAGHGIGEREYTCTDPLSLPSSSS